MWQFSSGYSAVLLRLIPSRHLPPTQYCERRSGQATDTIRRASPFAPLPVSANVGSHLRHERPDHTLQPTALVHEAWPRGRLGNQLRNAGMSHPPHYLPDTAFDPAGGRLVRSQGPSPGFSRGSPMPQFVCNGSNRLVVARCAM